MSALCGGDDLLNITEDGEYISEVQRNTTPASKLFIWGSREKSRGSSTRKEKRAARYSHKWSFC